jgi:pyruvate-ferredoxin/flavodoxin oxidoreductase
MRVTIDGNEAAASVAYRCNEVCCIFPITPSSPMAELADEWSSQARANVWGSVPTVVEMQSEGGAAGALHGALQGGALATTFTASQGLLLMIPNMYKIAGELTSAVLHVAARSLAAQGLSIFGDHSDVMAVRQTGFALLASASVQEAHDLALVAQAATLRTRVPFVHFFDGFRTSHELNSVELLEDDDLRALVGEDLVRAHRERSLSPERPFIRGTAQNPDIYFQARETVNPFYDRVPGVVQDAMNQLADRTGRPYGLVDYTGHPEAERVLVIMGSGAETARETVRFLAGRERVGVAQVRLYRPFPSSALVAALPPSARHVAVLDRTKEPGSFGEPLFLDVLASLTEAHSDGDLAAMPRVIGGRYGLSSKELTPGMVAGVLEELGRERPRRRFTIGINDDVSHTSLPYDDTLEIEAASTVRSVFFGLGSDGTVGANKNTIKILGSEAGLHAQGYFVYDSKKSGSQTVSHLRFGPEPIRAPYLVGQASFVGCHHFRMLERAEVLARAAPGATLLLNCRYGPGEVWDMLPRLAQEQILEKGIDLYVIDAARIARQAGLAGRINTVLQTCFFAISGVLPRERAIEAVKATIAKTYGRRGEEVVRRNQAAVDSTLAGLDRVDLPDLVTSTLEPAALVPASAPEFVRTVTATMMAGRGDELPVSALPVDGTYPSGTTAYEKRNISELVAAWDSELCIQCGNCSFVCPHSVIRSRYYDPARLDEAPEGFRSAGLVAPGLPDARYTLQVYVEDCTGCGLCVEACPAATPGSDPIRKAINLAAREPLVAGERENIAFFESLPPADRSRVDFGTVRGTQYLEPLFEFSGACEGCGETPYIKLLSQLFGDRLMVANATGCSSIYGGNLPTTPWTTDPDGRGPAWSNSLFEDNAEFGLGFRLAADGHTALARRLLSELRDEVGAELVDEILAAPQLRESELRAQRDRLAELERRLEGLDGPGVSDLRSVVDHLVRRSVWLVGGDGWAYDIGAGGLDHVLASGRNVNVLVLDTEVYSNTGGQMSKATPLGAVAKFAAAGKTVPKKDLALQAIAYGNVYVARVAMGADPQQTLTAFREAEAYDGPSLVLAYSHCIAHGIEMRNGLDQQHRAVSSGYWPLIRYDPMARAADANPFLLDSPRPRIPLADYTGRELRYRTLTNTHPAEAERLHALAEHAVALRWQVYEEMAGRFAPLGVRLAANVPGDGGEGD